MKTKITQAQAALLRDPQLGHCVKNQHLTIAFMHDNCRGRGQCDFKTHVIQATV